jgi:Tfp pilus assembly protein PilO
VRARERAIIVAVVVGALAIAFYVLVLGPKRDKVAELANQIDSLHASITAEQQKADFGEQARKNFPRYYGRLVVLGKAAPQQADTASMLVQLNAIAHRSQVSFDGISLSQGSDSAGTGTSSSSTPTTPTPPAAGTGTTSTTPSAPASTGTSTTATASSTTGSTGTSADASSSLVPATESSAASLPIGAVVGPAGYSTLPYDLNLKGSYFDISNFIGGIDGLVAPQNGGTQVSSNGRLFTIDGFSLNVGPPEAPQTLKADFLVTTYVTPADQGLTAGASPSGPAPSGSATPQALPASAVVSK